MLPIAIFLNQLWIENKGESVMTYSTNTIRASDLPRHYLVAVLRNAVQKALESNESLTLVGWAHGYGITICTCGHAEGDVGTYTVIPDVMVIEGFINGNDPGGHYEWPRQDGRVAWITCGEGAGLPW
jgi:hypothetical protein